MAGSEEDDYLNMTFDDPKPVDARETLTQRKKRLAREAEERSRPKSKTQLAEEQRLKREDALRQSIDHNSKGFKMMAALGYRVGSALGKDASASRAVLDDARLRVPLGLEMKEDRSGIGADSEKKRKFREEVERTSQQEKRQKVDADEFRVRQQMDRELKHQEGQFWAAMKVAERLAEDDAGESSVTLPIRCVNVLWRMLVKDRRLREQDSRRRHDMEVSRSGHAGYIDMTEEEDDIKNLDQGQALEEVELDLEYEDEELDEFQALEPAIRLEKILQYLRETHRYCFWCKHQYTDPSMEGCPGLTEDDHD